MTEATQEKQVAEREFTEIERKRKVDTRYNCHNEAVPPKKVDVGQYKCMRVTIRTECETHTIDTAIKEAYLQKSILYGAWTHLEQRNETLLIFYSEKAENKFTYYSRIFGGIYEYECGFRGKWANCDQKTMWFLENWIPESGKQEVGDLPTCKVNKTSDARLIAEMQTDIEHLREEGQWLREWVQICLIGMQQECKPETKVSWEVMCREFSLGTCAKNTVALQDGTDLIRDSDREDMDDDDLQIGKSFTEEN